MVHHWYLVSKYAPRPLHYPLANPGFGQWGTRNFVWDFADIAKQNWASKVSQYWPRSRTHLRALETLVFLTVKYAFFHFSRYFFLQNFTVALCRYITKYLLKYERFWPFLTNTMFLFLSEKIKGPICAVWLSLEIQHSVSWGSGAKSGISAPTGAACLNYFRWVFTLVDPNGVPGTRASLWLQFIFIFMQFIGENYTK